MSDQQPPEERPTESLSGRQSYNLIADTVTGVNVRGSDNLYQGLAVFIFLLLGVGIGSAISSSDRLAGALVGALLGLILGVLISGFVLMIYRFIRHAGGKHD